MLKKEIIINGYKFQFEASLSSRNILTYRCGNFQTNRGKRIKIVRFCGLCFNHSLLPMFDKAIKVETHLKKIHNIVEKCVLSTSNIENNESKLSNDFTNNLIDNIASALGNLQIDNSCYWELENVEKDFEISDQFLQLTNGNKKNIFHPVLCPFHLKNKLEQVYNLNLKNQ